MLHAMTIIYTIKNYKILELPAFAAAILYKTQYSDTGWSPSVRPSHAEVYMGKPFH